jgi:hypothetical protein
MNVQNIKELYSGYYGRAADMGGLNYWIDQAKAGMSIQTMAKHFADSAESKAQYTWLNNAGAPSQADAQAFVKKIYYNALARDPDAGGLAYWSNQLSSGAITADQIVLKVIQGAYSASINIDLPKMEELIYAQELGIASYSNSGVQMVLSYNAQWNNDVTNYWKTIDPNHTVQDSYNAKHNLAVTDFNQYFSQLNSSQQAMVMTDAQEAAIDVQLVGVAPTF